ncbi:PilW family protein [Dichelobacter nodosus]|uniref:Prepilin-type N-terminal cleavage/methylation domain-containing protein n=1 Tax=Dichelobacter nodosus (strain VCS1703A) TaxID=246195 RepID=A5EY89_DICNV|nr:PilW family protein [Dichelobacter nodosus]ABQ13715.1 hypothetical protein DNO_0893 [Dichelobacter nodosus VCS1703A]AXM45689.1 hypothetical protein DYQ38_04215 [Dichelobacter nodosus]KNZ39158.1 hypothetical protein AKG33_05310 [Dichelobacter nodosus]
MNYQSTHKFQKGISLMEMMVALTIGLILLLSLASIYVTANKMDKDRSLNEALDESARQIFERLQQDLNMAGYVELFDVSENIIEPITFKQIKGSDENKESRKHYNIIGNINRQDIQAAYARVEGWKSGSADIKVKTPFFITFGKEAVEELKENSRESLVIRYQFASSENSVTFDRNKNIPSGLYEKGDLEEKARLKESGFGRDCLGQKPEGKLVENKYFLQDGAFYCEGNGKNNDKAGNAEPIVDNVTELKFRYALTGYTPSAGGDGGTETTEDGGSNINVYSSQSGLYTDKIVKAEDVGGEWAKVIGVEACIVVAGEPLKSQKTQDIAELQPKIPTCVRDSKGNFNEDNNRPKNDTRLYRRYVRTFAVPNLIYFPLGGGL